MRYSWDREKNVRNIIRHGIAFQGFYYGESRVYAIGLVNGLEITVVYTDENDDEWRIISAWRAEPHERRSYWQDIEG
jgi:uncharacterized DUF497 family protein